MTCQGAISPAYSFLGSGSFCRIISSSSSQCERSKYFFFIEPVIASTIFPASPTSQTSEPIALSISAGSRSIWIIFASEAKLDLFPVVLSLKRDPIARMTSAVISALFATGWPCIPAIPSESPRGCDSGKAPFPRSEVTTGISSFSASSVSFPAAPERITPPPAKMTGLSACSRRETASSS